MKWFALILLLTQAAWVSSCIFDKVEGLKSVTLRKFESNNIHECFAACYEDVKCIGIQHWKNLEECHLLMAGDSYHSTLNDGSVVVYSLLRDDVDPMCQTFVNF